GTGATFCRLHFPEVGTIPKPRKTREFPELGLIVSQQRTLTNNHFTTGKTPTPRCWIVAGQPHQLSSWPHCRFLQSGT
ncbi:hypothetical protein, partial [Levilactobacillus spicheri]